MRAYAVFFGGLLTVGSVYIAAVAVESARPPSVARPAPHTPDTAALNATWYGGTLEPITVEARDAPPVAVTRVTTTRRSQSRTASGLVPPAAPLHPGHVGPTVD